MTFEYGRLDVIAVRQLSCQLIALAAGQALGAFLAADIDVAQDFFHLLTGCLSTYHGFGIQGIALFDLINALYRHGNKIIGNRFLDQRSRWAGANLTLVKNEKHEALNTLLQEVVLLSQDVFEKNIGRFAAQFQGDRILCSRRHTA